MNEDKKQEEYNLYTEKIVEPKTKKYRKILRAFKNLIYVVVLSAVAAIVFTVVSSMVSKMSGPEKPTKEQVTLGIPNENPSESETQPAGPSQSGEQQGTSATESESQAAVNDYKEFYDTALGISKEVQSSMVLVTSVVNTSEIFETSYESKSIGTIVIATDEQFYIMTEYAAIRNADRITISLQSGESCEAEFVNGDDITNIAIVTIATDAFETNVAKKLKAVAMGNSSFVETGEPVIAVGNICNGYFSMNYGIASNIQNVIYDQDSKYGIINTNISCGPDCQGILVDMSGRLVGVITNNYTNKFGNSLVSAYGISYLKTLIEQLSNGKEVLRIGIEGREVTADISSKYIMPKGIYITSIVSNSTAQSVGLQVGDIITRVEKTKIETFTDYQQSLFAWQPGDVITITVARRGNDGYKLMNYEVELTESGR